MSAAPVKLDMSTAQPLDSRAVKLDMSTAVTITPDEPADTGPVIITPDDSPPQAQAQSEQGHQNRMSLLAGFPGALPTVNMTPEDKESWEQGKAVGAMSVTLVAGAVATPWPSVTAALAPLAKSTRLKV